MGAPPVHRVALCRVLFASAVVDLVSLALLWWMPQWLLDLFSHPVPAEPFLFRLAALPLLMAPVVYVLAARTRESGLVTASIGLRVVGAIGIIGLLLVHRPAGAGAYWTFAGTDLVWAALYARLRA